MSDWQSNAKYSKEYKMATTKGGNLYPQGKTRIKGNLGTLLAFGKISFDEYERRIKLLNKLTLDEYKAKVGEL